MVVALPNDLEALRDITRGNLLALWAEVSSDVLPKKTSTPFLARLIAYEVQAQSYGGLGKRLQSKLERISEGGHASSPSKIATNGTRVVREWNGVQHTVDVTDQGSVYRGKTYRSLSAVAREITGTRWSGPRFFGLQRKSS